MESHVYGRYMPHHETHTQRSRSREVTFKRTNSRRNDLSEKNKNAGICTKNFPMTAINMLKTLKKILKIDKQGMEFLKNELKYPD